MPPDVGEFLAASHRQDVAAFDQLFSLLYDDLRRLARRYVRGEREGHTLNTTALVHEAYLKLARQSGQECLNRAQFLAFTSRAMRQILVDHARHRGAVKRGGDRLQVTLQTDMGVTEAEECFDLLALEAALDQLARRDPRLRVVVECRLFGGMAPDEIAEALGVTRRTVDRDWVRARTYLFHLLHPEATEH
jgi:RNA polymerase sigma factor (TIGR02999 family)